ncbi:sensor histidine kinase [[Limnothrix rosea] IAM M-220]|uniref:sensor histidine kinase n=1 Tax=[Limnothrix rosea] IAM M-220 TaxID=454133 RepID=UPI0009691863|nr:HAMP domain-containing sensor histidine kinase [[Limnothrix rosea] IAM M-220]OKH10769.1 hypothetical protein NIES208_18250 [[Limnothrix rosea] IAM M-220]
MLVALGAGIMSLAILETRRLLALVKGNRSSRTWRVLFYLMIFFLFGYAGVAILIGINISYVILLLIGTIFFLGSCFVLIVVKAGTFTIKELHQISAVKLELQKEKDVAEAIADLQTEFLNIMSHELRTPLNSILGFSQILNLSLVEKQELECSQNIYDSGVHLLKIIDYILEYTSLQTKNISLNIELFFLQDLIDDVCKKNEPAAIENNLEIVTWHLLDTSFDVKNDYLYIAQILEHLLNNAIKFTESGTVAIACHANETDVLFMIQDSGIGIKAEHIPKLFKPFSQGDSSNTRSHDGMGLGLILCQRRLEAIGGTIWLESNGLRAGVMPSPLLANLRNQLLDSPQALSESTGTLAFFSFPINVTRLPQ